jgi:hypothetical protein
MVGIMSTNWVHDFSVSGYRLGCFLKRTLRWQAGVISRSISPLLRVVLQKMRGWMRQKTSLTSRIRFASLAQTAKLWHLGKVLGKSHFMPSLGATRPGNLLVFTTALRLAFTCTTSQPFVSIHSQLAFTSAKLLQRFAYLAVQRLHTSLLTASTLTVQYFDAGHGSSMEKHKVKVQELVSEYQRFEGDTGCTEVQGKLAFLSFLPYTTRARSASILHEVPRNGSFTRKSNPVSGASYSDFWKGRLDQKKRLGCFRTGMVLSGSLRCLSCCWLSIDN